MVTSLLMTADELLRLPDDGHRYELIRGELRRMSPGSEKHGGVGVRFILAIGSFALPRNLGEVYGPDVGFVIQEHPDTVRCPDVSYVQTSRLPSTWQDGFLHLAPDLAIEIKSPFDREGELSQKVAAYLEAGVRQVWVVRPAARTITIHQADKEPLILRAEDVLDGGDILPGFRFPVASLFPSR